MDNKEYVVIYTDIGDTCDGLARVLTTTATLQEAQAKMTKDVNNYLLEIIILLIRKLILIKSLLVIYLMDLKEKEFVGYNMNW